MLSKNCDHVVEIWTGRSERVRDKTLRWLRQHMPTDAEFDFFGIEPYFECRGTILLRMRGVDDFTPDYKLKKQWMDESLRYHKKVNLVFEDRIRVVQMWRSQGVLCCHVGGGDF